MATYNLYSCSDLSKQNAQLVATLDSTGKYYEHDVSEITPPDGTICYFVEALEGLGNQYGFMEKSYSNVICLEQEPVLYIPNAFVFGGLSENFGPKGIYENMAAEYNFSIWDRWGEKLFETKSPGQNWDATYKGKKVPIGVYVYMLDFTSLKGKSINRIGIVTVIETNIIFPMFKASISKFLLLFLFSLFFVLLLTSCKKNAENLPPEIHILSPKEGNYFQVDDEIKVILQVKDDIEIKYIKVGINDQNSVAIAPSQTININQKNSEKSVSFKLDNSTIKGGKCFISVLASDGEKETKKYVEIIINELPKIATDYNNSSFRSKHNIELLCC